jgi:hypothetical protein
MGYWAVDFDGTICGNNDLPITSDEFLTPFAIVTALLNEGCEVRILTARVSSNLPTEEINKERLYIEAWTQKYLGETLIVTSEKTYDMIALIDDRAVACEHHTGRLLGGHSVFNWLFQK